MTERPSPRNQVLVKNPLITIILASTLTFSWKFLLTIMPNLDTMPSNLSVRGEIAFETRLPKADQFEGESTIYVDDFEGSQSTIDMFSLCGVSSTQIGMSEAHMILMPSQMI
jgi:cell surface protein SprA